MNVLYGTSVTMVAFLEIYDNDNDNDNEEVFIAK